VPRPPEGSNPVLDREIATLERLTLSGGEMPNRIRALRFTNGYAIRKLASRSGVSIRTVQSVETGRRCRRDTQRRLLRGLGIDFCHRGVVFPDQSEDT
jgi:DNA-binding transcriptional regulator YiaG